jgi:polyferredoxin
MSAVPGTRPLPTAIRRPRRGLAALRGVQGFRRAVQTATAVLVGWLIFARLASTLRGPEAPTAPEALCPLGGIETFATFVMTGGFVQHVHLSNVVLAVAVLLTAFFARGAFCGWVCPLGFLQDLVTGLSRALQRRFPPLRRGVRSLERRAAPLAVIDRPLRLLKYVVLAWAIGGAAVFGVMVFRDVDPWAAILDIGKASAGFGLVVLATMLVAALVVPRPWCRYACPLGAATGLVSRFSPVRLERVETACAACGACSKACPMGLPVATAQRITSPDCNGCLECVESCSRAGGLEVRVGLPVIGVARRPAVEA